MGKEWVLSLVLATAAAGQADFRNANWGMIPAQVKALEPGRGADISQGAAETAMEYGGIRMGGIASRVVYIFSYDRLQRAKYVFEADHRDLNEFIRDFRNIQALLIERHGKPVLDRAIWEDDSTQLEPKSYLDQDRASPANILPSDPNVGLAVSLGHLKLVTQWESPRTRVAHVLTGQDHQVTHEIEYRGTEAVKAARER